MVTLLKDGHLLPLKHPAKHQPKHPASFPLIPKKKGTLLF